MTVFSWCGRFGNISRFVSGEGGKTVAVGVFLLVAIGATVAYSYYHNSQAQKEAVNSLESAGLSQEQAENFQEKCGGGFVFPWEDANTYDSPREQKFIDLWSEHPGLMENALDGGLAPSTAVDALKADPDSDGISINTADNLGLNPGERHPNVAYALDAGLEGSTAKKFQKTYLKGRPRKVIDYVAETGLTEMVDPILRDVPIREREVTSFRKFTELYENIPPKYREGVVENFSPGGISRNEERQIDFLLNSSENLAKLASEGKICDMNWDNDYGSNLFEGGIKNITDPEVHNDRYALLVNAKWNPNRSQWVKERFDKQYDFFHKEMGIPENHIVRIGNGVIEKSPYPYGASLGADFCYAVDGSGENAWDQYSPDKVKIGEEAYRGQPPTNLVEMVDGNDLFFASFQGHGDPDSFLSIGTYGVSGVEPVNIANKLDKIDPKAQYIQVNACYSGGAIDFLQPSPVPRVVITSTRENEVGGSFELVDTIYPAAMSDIIDVPGTIDPITTFPDKDNNSFVSIQEAFQESKRTPFGNGYQISDPDNIADKLYFGEYFIRENFVPD